MHSYFVEACVARYKHADSRGLHYPASLVKICNNAQYPPSVCMCAAHEMQNRQVDYVNTHSCTVLELSVTITHHLFTLGGSSIST